MPGQTEVREQQKEKLSRNLTCSHNIYPHPFCLREKKKRGFAIGICKVNPCVFDERSPCSGLKSLVEELQNKHVFICVYSQLQWERSERESIPSSTFSQTHSSASEPAAAQGVGGCTSISSKSTRLSGQLKQAQCLAQSYKELGPAGGVLFDGEVIKMDGHPANYL